MKAPKLTRVEWEVMEAVWELTGAPSIREVLDHAFSDGEKAYTTVQTIMNTLEKKGLLVRKKKGLANFYRPTRTRDEMIKSEMSTMLDRVFQGSRPALADTLFSMDDLSLEEITQIKQLLRRKEKELKGGRA